MSAGSLINRLQLNDELLETNLNGAEIWHAHSSFFTFSCAEYYSHDIVDYLKTVNNVPESYDVGKLCIEDPISVSRQFSLKFHMFFNKILIKGKVLGTVDHVEEGIPESWCSPLPFVAMDMRCPCHRS